MQTQQASASIRKWIRLKERQLYIYENYDYRNVLQWDGSDINLPNDEKFLNIVPNRAPVHAWTLDASVANLVVSAPVLFL